MPPVAMRVGCGTIFGRRSYFWTWQALRTRELGAHAMLQALQHGATFMYGPAGYEHYFFLLLELWLL